MKNRIDRLYDMDERLTKIEDKSLKLTINLNRMIGEFTEMLEGICLWDIPKKLKDKLEIKIKKLKED